MAVYLQDKSLRKMHYIRQGWLVSMRSPSLHNNARGRGQAWAGSHARSPRPTQPRQKR